MDRRLLLHAVLCKLLNCPEMGDACRAYFQPPPNTKMQYDCIVYERSRMDTDFADNLPPPHPHPLSAHSYLPQSRQRATRGDRQTPPVFPRTAFYI